MERQDAPATTSSRPSTGSGSRRSAASSSASTPQCEGDGRRLGALPARRPLAPLPPGGDRRRRARPRRVEPPALHGRCLGPGAGARGVPPRRRSRREGGLAVRVQAALQPGRPPRVLGGEARPRRRRLPQPLRRRRRSTTTASSPRTGPRLGPHPGRRRRWLRDDARTAERPNGDRAGVVDEEAQHPTVRSRSARGDESGPAFPPELLADGLIRPPRLPPGHRRPRGRREPSRSPSLRSATSNALRR